MRTAMESRPPAAMAGTESSRSSTIASGPGQHARARTAAASGHDRQSDFAISTDDTWAISGLSAGRSLAT